MCCDRGRVVRGRGEAEGTRALSLFFRRRLLGLLPPPSCLLGPYVSLLTYWFPPIISFFLEPGFLWFSLHHCCFPPSFLFFIICFCSFLCLVSPLLALQIPVPFHLFSFPFVLTRRAGLPSLAPSRVAAPVANPSNPSPLTFCAYRRETWLDHWVSGSALNSCQDFQGF